MYFKVIYIYFWDNITSILACKDGMQHAACSMQKRAAVETLLLCLRLPALEWKVRRVRHLVAARWYYTRKDDCGVYTPRDRAVFNNKKNSSFENKTLFPQYCIFSLALTLKKWIQFDTSGIKRLYLFTF